MSGRIEREKDCIGKMVAIYCKGVHGTKVGLCPDCRELLDYADMRVDKCRFGAQKSTCAKCVVHCFKRDVRERVKEVMRYAGPKMSYTHPWLSFMHFLDGFRKPKEKVRS
jgi:hypothetical protein